MPMFGVVYLNPHFSRKFINYKLKSCLVLRAALTGTRNQKKRSHTDSFRCHKHDSDLKILKRVSIRNHVF